MIYGSLCSGIEAASVAWEPLGWKPAFFSEVDKNASRVLAHHYPHVPNHGDMTKFKDWPDYAIDVLVGGTPCQSFSVAGLRKGLDDPRGNLMLTYLAIARRYKPKWLVWENVPGVLSSNKGGDFGTFLGGLAELGYGFAYRILDAQFIRVESYPRAVPQRRRRVFVVGHLGDWRCAAAVLFERESLSGNPSPRRKTGQSFTEGFEGGADFCGTEPLARQEDTDKMPFGFATDHIFSTSKNNAQGRVEGDGERSAIGSEASSYRDLGSGSPPREKFAIGFETGPHGGGFTDLAPTMDARAKDGPIRNQLGIGVMTFDRQSSGEYGDEQLASTMSARDYKSASDLVAHTLLGKANSSHDETLETYVAGTMKSMSSSGGWSNSVDHAAAGYMVPVETYPINTQIALRHEATGRGTGMGRGVPILPIAFDAKGTQVQFEEFGVASTLRSMGHANSHKNGGGHSAVALNIYGGNKRSDRPDGGFYVSDDGVSKTLDSSTGLNPTAAQGGTAIVNSWAVRRLTPVECARLQGFSDTYLDLPNKPLADGPKYKMLGNSMAVNVMRWIGQRIEMVEGLTKKRGLANQSPSSLPPLG